MYCQYKAYFSSKDNTFKVKGQRKRTRMAILIPAKINFKAKI